MQAVDRDHSRHGQNRRGCISTQQSAPRERPRQRVTSRRQSTDRCGGSNQTVSNKRGKGRHRVARLPQRTVCQPQSVSDSNRRTTQPPRTVSRDNVKWKGFSPRFCFSTEVCTHEDVDASCDGTYAICLQDVPACPSAVCAVHTGVCERKHRQDLQTKRQGARTSRWFFQACVEPPYAYAAGFRCNCDLSVLPCFLKCR